MARFQADFSRLTRRLDLGDATTQVVMGLMVGQKKMVGKRFLTREQHGTLTVATHSVLAESLARDHHAAEAFQILDRLKSEFPHNFVRCSSEIGTLAKQLAHLRISEFVKMQSCPVGCSPRVFANLRDDFDGSQTAARVFPRGHRVMHGLLSRGSAQEWDEAYQGLQRLLDARGFGSHHKTRWPAIVEALRKETLILSAINETVFDETLRVVFQNDPYGVQLHPPPWSMPETPLVSFAPTPSLEEWKETVDRFDGKMRHLFQKPTGWRRWLEETKKKAVEETRKRALEEEIKQKALEDACRAPWIPADIWARIRSDPTGIWHWQQARPDDVATRARFLQLGSPALWLEASHVVFAQHLKINYGRPLLNHWVPWVSKLNKLTN